MRKSKATANLPAPFLTLTRLYTFPCIYRRSQVIVQRMGLPAESITLTPEQVAGLNRKLADMRHDINGHLAVMVAALELLRHKPDSAQRMLGSLGEQPAKISEAIKKFSLECEQVLQITRP